MQKNNNSNVLTKLLKWNDERHLIYFFCFLILGKKGFFGKRYRRTDSKEMSIFFVQKRFGP